MPLNVPKKTKTLAQELSQKAQKSTAALRSAAMHTAPEDYAFDASPKHISPAKAITPPLRDGTFDTDWLEKNKGILHSNNDTAKKMYTKVYDAEQFTRQAETELQKLDKRIAIRFELSAAADTINPNVILRNILKDYPALQRMDEGRMGGSLVPLTRPLNYSFEDIAAKVNDKANVLNKRKGAARNNADLSAAAQNEKSAVIAAQGNTLQDDIAPKSWTAGKSILWDEGAAVAWNINTWLNEDEEVKGSDLRVSSGGGGAPDEEIYLRDVMPIAYQEKFMPLGMGEFRILAAEQERKAKQQSALEKESESNWSDSASAIERSQKEASLVTPERPIIITDGEGKEVIVPKYVDGKNLTDREAAKRYAATGENFGKFNDWEEADIHIDQIDPAKQRPYARTYSLSDFQEDEKRDIKSSEVNEPAASVIQPTEDSEIKSALGVWPFQGDYKDYVKFCYALGKANTMEELDAYFQEAVQTYPGLVGKKGVDLSPEGNILRNYNRKRNEFYRIKKYGSIPMDQKSSAQLINEMNDIISRLSFEFESWGEAIERNNAEYDVRTQYEPLIKAARQREIDQHAVTEDELRLYGEEWEKKNIFDKGGSYIASGVKNGFGGFNKSLISAIDLPLRLARAFDRWAPTYDEQMDTSAWGQIKNHYALQAVKLSEESTKISSITGDVGETGQSIISSGIQMIPSMLLALISGGTSLYAGAVAALSTSGSNSFTFMGTMQKVLSNLIGQTKTAPFWVSYIQESGDQFADAKEKGADDITASLSAITTGLYNAAIEVGGGVEAGKTNPLVIGKDEMLEEIGQGITARSMASGYSDAPVFSIENADAIINPKTMIEEGVGGFVGGYLFGGISSTLENIYKNLRNSIDSSIKGGYVQDKPAMNAILEAIDVALGTKLTSNGSIQPPAQAEIEIIEQLESDNNYAGAASARYNAITGVLQSSTAGADALAANEGAVSMAAAMMVDTAKAESSGTPIDPQTRAQYEQMAQTVLGIDKDCISQIASFFNEAVNTTNAAVKSTDLTGTLSTIAGMDDATLKQVLSAFMSDGDLDLPTAQTLFRLIKLRQAMLGTDSDVDSIAGYALAQATSNALKGADIDTGNLKLDDALMAAASTSHYLDVLLKRWGMKGVNYISNLIQASYAKEAALILSLPSYAKAVIVAEESMSTMALNQDAIQALINAAAQDMQDPYLVKNAAKRAHQQALYAIKAELIEMGSLGEQSGFTQEVKDAQRIVTQSKTNFNKAVQIEKIALNTFAEAQANFDKNPADTDATNVLLAALKSVQEAGNARMKAEQSFINNQRAYSITKQNLADIQQQAMAKVDAQAKQRLRELNRQRAQIKLGLNEKSVEQETVPPDQMNPENVSNFEKNENHLAQVNESVIMEESSQGENGNGTLDKGGLDGQAAEGTAKRFVDVPFDEYGKLLPNVMYKAGEFGYDYETDSLGRIERFSTSDLKFTTRTQRLNYNRKTPGKLPGDQAGHLIADRFGGSPKIDNLVSQLSKVNQSEYKKIENKWANAMKAGEKVQFNVDIKYGDSNSRPTSFHIVYTIGINEFTVDLAN